MKILPILFTALILAGCGLIPENKTPVKNTYDSQGRLVQSQTELTGGQYIDYTAATAKSNCQQSYYALPSGATEKDVALLRSVQGLTMATGVDPCPHIATSNEVKIRRSDNLNETAQTFIRKLVPIATILGGAYVGKSAVKNRDPVIVEPSIRDPFVVREPFVVEVPTSTGE